MKRWALHDYVENQKVDAFIEEVIAVCHKHGLSISHEDKGGAFEIVDINNDSIDWLRQAHDLTGS